MARCGLRLNKVCSLEDWNDEEFQKALLEVGWTEFKESGVIHRKHWEHALGFIALRAMGKLHDDSRGLGIGCGKERIVFALANRVGMIIATDLYGDPGPWSSDAPGDILTQPEKYAPFKYRKDHLVFLRMDGRRLQFPSGQFDFVFSFSAIEHFGGHKQSLRSFLEMERVVKPGGIVVLATEFILNGVSHPDYFDAESLFSELIDRTALSPVDDPILRASDASIETAFTIEEYLRETKKGRDTYFKNPHVVLIERKSGAVFTSVLLTLKKSVESELQSGSRSHMG